MSAETPEAESKGAVAVVALGVAVVALVAAVVFSVLAHQESGERSDRAQALAAAKTRVPILLSYSFRTLDEDLVSSLDQTTGKFRDDYGKLLDSVVRSTATKQKITTRAEVTGAGIVRAEGDRVVTLLFITQATTQNATSPTVTTNRVEVTMRRSGDDWKIARLDPR